jgi:hypothetical protein
MRSLLAPCRTQDVCQSVCMKGYKPGHKHKHLTGGPAAVPQRPVDLGQLVGQVVDAVGVEGAWASRRRIMRGETKERIAPIGKGVDEPALRRRNRAIVREFIEQAGGRRGTRRGNG